MDSAASHCLGLALALGQLRYKLTGSGGGRNTGRRAAARRYPSQLNRARERFLQSLGELHGSLEAAEAEALAIHVGEDPLALAGLWRHPAHPGLSPGELAWFFRVHARRWGRIPQDQAALGQMVEAGVARGASPTHGAFACELVLAAVDLPSLAAVRALLAAGAPAHQEGVLPGRASPLSRALLAERLDIAQCLLEAGAPLAVAQVDLQVGDSVLAREWVAARARAQALDLKLDSGTGPEAPPSRPRM